MVLTTEAPRGPSPPQDWELMCIGKGAIHRLMGKPSTCTLSKSGVSSPVRLQQTQWVGGGVSMQEFPKMSLEDHLYQNHLKDVLNLGARDSAF